MKTTHLYLIISGILLSCSAVFAQVPSYVPTTGLKAWLGFNGSASDLSGNGNNPTNTGATFVADRNGNPSAAASFNGTSNYMEITTPNFTFSETGAFSYSFWMNKQTQISAAGIAMMSGTGTTGVFITLIQGVNNFTFGTNKQQSSWFFINCPHTLNVWDHYVTTYNAGVMKIYKNGVFQTTTTYLHTGAATATIPFMIGRGLGGNSTCFKGTLDDIGIWNRELSTTEITALFTGITAVPSLDLSMDDLLFPNPTNEELKFNFNSNLGSAYQIVDNSGRIVLSGELDFNSSAISVASLKPAAYFIQFIKDGRITSSKKFMKE